MTDKPGFNLPQQPDDADEPVQAEPVGGSDPFGGLNLGGFDMGALMEQAQAMGQQLQEAQESLADTEVEGSVAGGSVKVTVNGVGDLVAVALQPGVVDGADEESLADLGDLIVAAYRDAKSQAETMAAQTLGPLAGGLGGMGGPGGDPSQPSGGIGFGFPGTGQ